MSVNINELLAEPLTKIKRPLSFWEWPDRKVRDEFIACALLEELIVKQGWRIADRSVRGAPFSNKSPDVVARFADGGTIALELTEWVDQKHLKAMIEGRRRDPPTFSAQAVRTGIDHCLERKRHKKLVGGPYALRVLVIHTAQELVAESAWTDLQHSYTPSDLAPWHQAYVILPPPVGNALPRQPKCQYVQLHP
jgi:hypothetical protein